MWLEGNHKEVEAIVPEFTVWLGDKFKMCKLKDKANFTFLRTW